MGGCAPLGLSSRSGSPPLCDGWPRAEAGATVQAGTAYLALWEEGGIRARPFIPGPPVLVVAFLGCFCQAVVSLATSHRHAAGGRGTRPAACGFCVQYRNHWLHGAHLGSLPTAVDPAPCGPLLVRLDQHLTIPEN